MNFIHSNIWKFEQLCLMKLFQITCKNYHMLYTSNEDNARSGTSFWFIKGAKNHCFLHWPVWKIQQLCVTKLIQLPWNFYHLTTSPNEEGVQKEINFGRVFQILINSFSCLAEMNLIQICIMKVIQMTQKSYQRCIWIFNNDPQKH